MTTTTSKRHIDEDSAVDYEGRVSCCSRKSILWGLLEHGVRNCVLGVVRSY